MRHWTSSKERKGRSTPTAGTSQVDGDLLLRLQQLPNVIISPHTAYFTDHALADIVDRTLVNCLSFEGGN